MKEIIALLVLLSFAIVTFYLAVTKQIDGKLALLFLAFSLFAGFGIANYDLTKRGKWKDFEFEAFEQKVKETKESAIDEIRREVSTQKQNLETTKNDIAKISSLMFKMAFVLAEGSRRFDGVPEEHEDKLREYLNDSPIPKEQKEKILSEVEDTLKKLNDTIEERNKKQNQP